MKKEVVLLTGAGGSVGIMALKHLIEHKDRYDIIATDINTKKVKKRLAPFNGKIKIVYGDINSKEHLSNITENIDYTIHLAAIIPPLADQFPDKAFEVNVNGTKLLTEYIRNNSPGSFFIYSSSISIYGDRINDPNISVGDPLIPSDGDEYAKTKIQAEKIVQDSGLDWTIFRLCAIMGNDNTRLDPLFFHMPLDTPLEIATTNDTGRAVVTALQHKDQLNHRIFNLGGGEKCRISYRDFISKAFIISGLGKMQFPEGAFAQQNFHCGYYQDGDELEKIIGFRKQTLDDYYHDLKDSISPFQYFSARLLGKFVQKKLLTKSDPYNALKNKNEALIQRFFHTPPSI